MKNMFKCNSMRAKIWEAIRALRTFTTDELETMTEGAPSNVRKYLRVLELAGYLSKTPSPNQRACATYRLIRDTGIKYPVQKMIRVLWDPNTDEIWRETRSPKNLRGTPAKTK